VKLEYVSKLEVQGVKIGGHVKGIRARLYYDAGIDSVEKMADWEPEALRRMVAEFVART